MLPSCGALGLPWDYPVAAPSSGAGQSVAQPAKSGLSPPLPVGQGTGSERVSQSPDAPCSVRRLDALIDSG